MKPSFIDRGGLWVLCQSALLFTVFCFGFCARGNWEVFPLRITGVILLLVAAWCGIAGTVVLGRNLTPFPRPAPNGRIVQHGIYRLIRHPLYTSVILAGFGWALVWLSWPSAIAAAVLVPLLHAKSQREEFLLRGKFPEYREYEARTRRFIPWIY